MSQIKSWEKFIIDNGLLFEINRKVLHPLGLSLEPDTHPDDKRKVCISCLMETDDDEGFLYDEDSFEYNESKLEVFMKKRGSRALASRERVLGYIEQSKANVAKILEEKRRERDSVPKAVEPRYDEVFEEGIKDLDESL